VRDIADGVYVFDSGLEMGIDRHPAPLVQQLGRDKGVVRHSPGRRHIGVCREDLAIAQRDRPQPSLVVDLGALHRLAGENRHAFRRQNPRRLRPGRRVERWQHGVRIRDDRDLGLRVRLGDFAGELHAHRARAADDDALGRFDGVLCGRERGVELLSGRFEGRFHRARPRGGRRGAAGREDEVVVGYLCRPSGSGDGDFLAGQVDGQGRAEDKRKVGLEVGVLAEQTRDLIDVLLPRNRAGLGDEPRRRDVEIKLVCTRLEGDHTMLVQWLEL
jgi:hypothetical protein